MTTRMVGPQPLRFPFRPEAGTDPLPLQQLVHLGTSLWEPWGLHLFFWFPRTQRNELLQFSLSVPTIQTLLGGRGTASTPLGAKGFALPGALTVAA